MFDRGGDQSDSTSEHEGDVTKGGRDNKEIQVYTMRNKKMPIENPTPHVPHHDDSTAPLSPSTRQLF